jgi:hypothetical protein
MTLKKISLQLWIDLKQGMYPPRARNYARSEIRKNYEAHPKGKGAKAWKRLAFERKRHAATCVWWPN